MAPRRPRFPVEFWISALSLVALACGLAGCDNDHHHRPPEPDPPPYFDLWEREPNDAACCPDDLGVMFVGDELVIGGDIRDDGFDPYDGFGIESGEPFDVEFYLEPVDSYADLDLGVWDPVRGEFVLLWDSPDAVESGRFTVPGTFDQFQLVVMSFDGDAEYRLYVWIEPATFFTPLAAAAAPSKAARPVPLELYHPEDMRPPVD
ncbi:MAG: hypothetical protein IT454_21310 [Planctomycetes bacterium]|nr:hypothetical protein [Planctomycetota bacterium]